MKFAFLLLLTVGSSIQCLEKKFRLSGNVLPSFYSLKIHPDIDRETFEGNVRIHVKSLLAVDYIELHCSGLRIDSVHFDLKNVSFIHDLCQCSLSSDELVYEFLEYDLMRIRYGKRRTIPPGSHVIQIEYKGEFSKTTLGMFKTGYTKNGTLLSQLIATDFQPNLARQVFPCFDEPSFKAKFQLSLVVPNDTYTALSNMRAVNKLETSAGTVYKFETTPPMSTYLLSFVISRHECEEYVDEIPYRICSFDGSHGNNTDFFRFFSRTMQFYENYTGVKYTLPKVDFVDFDRTESVATENWGLITLKSALLSSDSGDYDLNQKINVFAHELAHFWFGNLVTNYWWSDVWLQEGLATFMSIKAEDYVLDNSASKYFPQTFTDNLLWTERSTDNLTSIVSFEDHPARIRENFNDVAYYKAAAVVRMLEEAIGEESLQEGVRRYLQKYAFEAASTNDFLSIVEALAPDVAVREFMETYLYQSGYPLVYVHEEEDNFVLIQHSCCQKNAPSSFRYKWTLPITYITDLNNSSSIVWLYKDMESLILPKNNATLIKLNYRKTGYYRVNYSLDLWQKFIGQITELERDEGDDLLLEAADLFQMDLLSCEVVLKYFFQLVYDNLKESYLNAEHSIIAFVKLSDKLKHHKEAYNDLTVFYKQILEMTRRRKLVDFFSKNYENELPEENDNQSGEMSQKTRECIDWLKTESKEYLQNRLSNNTRSE